MDGRYGFKRSWEKFKRGFGRLDLEFWLGKVLTHTQNNITNITYRSVVRYFSI